MPNRKEMFWNMESADPLYHQLLLAVSMAGNTNRPPCLRPKSHHLEELMCSFRERELYCVSTATRCTRELLILESAKSMAL
jgi:hypothetical protein